MRNIIRDKTCSSGCNLFSERNLLYLMIYLTALSLDLSLDLSIDLYVISYDRIKNGTLLFFSKTFAPLHSERNLQLRRNLLFRIKFVILNETYYLH